MASPNPKQFAELAQVIAEKGLSLQAAADEIRCHKNVLWKLLNGRLKRFDIDLIRNVSRFSGERVGPQQFMDFYERLRPAAPKPQRRAA